MENFYNEMEELSSYLNRLKTFFQNLINDLQDQIDYTPAYTFSRVYTGRIEEIRHDLTYQSDI